MSTPARVPAGVAGGGRFAPQSWMHDTGPLPLLDRPSATELPPPGDVGPAGWRADPHSPARTLVPAPRCPHGHFRRWARTHCRPCTTPTRGGRHGR